MKLSSSPGHAAFVRRTAIAFAFTGYLFCRTASAQQSGTADTPVTRYVNPPVPLLSIGALSFLEGTWTAESHDGKQQLGTYTWATELNGHVLARHGVVSPGCSPQANAACGRSDLLYVYQDSAGAPLRAIYFDNEGHVLRYEISIRHDELPGGTAHREFAIFLSDAAALGPRYRLTYERNTDTLTGASVLNGRFEMQMANYEWRTLMEWFGKKS